MKPPRSMSPGERAEPPTEADRPRPTAPRMPADRSGAGPSASDEVNVYCRICRRALNTRTHLGGISYHHAAELRGESRDHEPDPVPLTRLPDPVMVCDFCNTGDPVWTYVCGDQLTEFRMVTGRTVGLDDYHKRHGAARVRRTDTAPGLANSWGQRWAACQACAAHVEARNLYGLIGRVTETLPAKLTRGKRLVETRGRLHATFTTVFETLLPGRGRITAEAPLGVWEDPPGSGTGPAPNAP